MTGHRRDRYGEELEDEEVHTSEDERHVCDRGWLGEDAATGRPRPCPTCKPHLLGARRRFDAQLHGGTR